MLNIQNPYLNLTQRIELYQRWILVHSYLYYELDDPIKQDEEFDLVVRSCLGLMEKNRKYKNHKTRYSHIFEKFNGSCFNLYNKCPEELKKLIKEDAKMILRRRERYGSSSIDNSITYTSGSD